MFIEVMWYLHDNKWFGSQPFGRTEIWQTHVAPNREPAPTRRFLPALYMFLALKGPIPSILVVHFAS